MAYQTLLFDIDDTLLDFHASEDAALEMLFAQLHLNLTSEIKSRYDVINQDLWRQFERQEINRQNIFERRFPTLFEEFKLTDTQTALTAEEIYRDGLNHGHQQIPQAQELLQQLSTQSALHLYIVSNGVAKTQNMRLHDSGFAKYFTNVFVSEAVGYQKPDVHFFDVVAQDIPEFNQQQALIIGDSLTSDIQGGINAGIDTVWFNPHHQQATQVRPTYEIDALPELLKIVGVSKD